MTALMSLTDQKTYYLNKAKTLNMPDNQTIADATTTLRSTLSLPVNYPPANTPANSTSVQFTGTPISVADLIVPYAFGQRVRNRRTSDANVIRKMADNFDFTALTSITVMEIAGTQYLVDGQGRALAAHMAGVADLPGTIITGHSYEDLFGLFNKINDDKTNIPAFSKFTNKVMTDTADIKLESNVHKAMTSIGVNMNPHTPDPIPSNNFTEGHGQLVGLVREYPGIEQYKSYPYTTRTYYILKLAMQIHRRAYPDEKILLGSIGSLMCLLHYLDFATFDADMESDIENGQFDINSPESEKIIEILSGVLMLCTNTELTEFIDDELSAVKGFRVEYLDDMHGWFKTSREFGNKHNVSGNQLGIRGAFELIKYWYVLSSIYLKLAKNKQSKYSSWANLYSLSVNTQHLKKVKLMWAGACNPDNMCIGTHELS